MTIKIKINNQIFEHKSNSDNFAIANEFLKKFGKQALDNKLSSKYNKNEYVKIQSQQEIDFDKYFKEGFPALHDKEEYKKLIKPETEEDNISVLFSAIESLLEEAIKAQQQDKQELYNNIKPQKQAQQVNRSKEECIIF